MSFFFHSSTFTLLTSYNWEYRVITVKKTGEGAPSNTVAGVV